MPITPEFELVRRMISMQRWLASMVYVLVYPEAMWEQYLVGGPKSTDKTEAMDWAIDRVIMHAEAIKRLADELDFDPKE